MSRKCFPLRPHCRPCSRNILTMQLPWSLARLPPCRREDVGAHVPIPPHTLLLCPPTSLAPSAPSLLSLAAKCATHFSECFCHCLWEVAVVPCPHLADEEIKLQLTSIWIFPVLSLKYVFLSFLGGVLPRALPSVFDPLSGTLKMGCHSLHVTEKAPKTLQVRWLFQDRTAKGS